MAERTGQLDGGATKRHSAQSLLELAIVIPIMLLIFLAVVDFGRGFYAGVALEGAAREGARYAAANRCVSTGACTTQESAIRATVLQAVGPNDPTGIASLASLPICSSDPPPATGKPCATVANFDRTGSSATIRDDGYTIRVRVYADVVLVTSFLAEGVAGFAPGLGGLCYNDASNNKICRIPVGGEAYMVVL